MGNAKIRQMLKFKYLGNVLIKEGKSDTEVRTPIEIANKDFKMITKLLRSRKVSLEAK